MKMSMNLSKIKFELSMIICVFILFSSTLSLESDSLRSLTENGYLDYFALRFVHSGLCLDAEKNATHHGGKIIQYNCHQWDNQLLHFSLQKDGFFIIEFKHSGKVLEVKDGSHNNGEIIHQADKNYGDSQKWHIDIRDVASDHGWTAHIRLKNKRSNKCLEIRGASTNVGQEVIQWDCNEGNNQRFTFFWR